MTSYAELRRRDRLPTVGVLQKLLNRTGARLTVDGDFGPRTEKALLDFQRARGIPESGIADDVTWSRLLHQTELPIVDCVDVFPLLSNIYTQQARTLIESGSKPLMFGGMSNALGQLAQALSGARGVFLLRVVGHGAAGIQGVAIGVGGWLDDQKKPHFWGDQRSKFETHNARQFAGSLDSAVTQSGSERVSTGGLRQVFGPYASMELHGCHTGAGAKGRKLLDTLADSLSIPVSAGIGSQQSVLRFDGAVHTSIPGRKSLRSWCRQLPDFPSITVP